MIEIIPAIDIINGQCVRLTKGNYNTQKVYDSDPVAVALRFEQMGVKRLHVVDLDGARSKHIVNIDILRRITSETSLVVDFGGGIKSDDDIEKALEAGAAMVTVGSIAVTDPERTQHWIRQYGADRFILGADARDGRISINGWKEDTGEELLNFIRRYYEHGIHRVLCTDISRDGMLQGPATELYRTIMQAFPNLHLIASGGVSGNADILALDAAGIPAVVFGKAFYEGNIRLEELIVC